MSIIEVKVPQLSESVSEATLLTWHKQAGATVAEGENLIDIETDKVVLELPASKSGVLTRIIKGDGEKVTSNELIAQIDTDAKAVAVPDVGALSVGGELVEPRAVPVLPPSVRKLARENEIDAANLHGSGRGGRNQEFALAAATRLPRIDRVSVLASVGSDGVDGPTDAAGAFADSTTVVRARQRGLDPMQYLDDNDSWTFFESLGDLVRTGVTGTNVGDLQVALIAPPAGP